MESKNKKQQTLYIALVFSPEENNINEDNGISK